MGCDSRPVQEADIWKRDQAKLKYSTVLEIGVSIQLDVFSEHSSCDSDMQSVSANQIKTVYRTQEEMG